MTFNPKAPYRIIDTRKVIEDAPSLMIGASAEQPDYALDIALAGTLIWQTEVPESLQKARDDVLDRIRVLSFMCDEVHGMEAFDPTQQRGYVEERHPEIAQLRRAYEED